ncbi:MAG: glycosyltransferase family 4 protein [Minisyncoccota bacterium]
MKLVIATPLYPPEIGGPATYAKLLEEGLPRKGIEVELVKFSDVRHLPKVARHFAYSWRIFRALRSADLALALDPVSTGLPACVAVWLARKPLVVKVVGDYAWEQGRQRFGVTATLDEFVKEKRVPLAVWLLRRVQLKVASCAKRVIVPSEYLKGIVVKWDTSTSLSTRTPREKIEVIYNAILLEEFGSIPEAVIKLPRPLIVTAGRLVPWKHIDRVIDAVAGIAGTSLTVVGDGSDRAALEHRAIEKLSGRMVFTGALPHKDLLAVLKSADVFVLNSSYEGLSHLLIEAQMLGVPTVATNAGGNSEVIKDGENGLLVPVADTPALAGAIGRLLSDPGLRARLQAAAIESSRRFSIEEMLSATAVVLQNI